jgi:hypothetical protein
MEHWILGHELLQFFRRKYQGDEVLVSGDVEHGRFILEKAAGSKVVTLSANIYQKFFVAIVE